MSVPGAFCTIGTVSELVERRLREWKSSAIRELLELETQAKQLRDALENDSMRLDQMEHQASDINSHITTFTTYVDRASFLAEAGLW